MKTITKRRSRSFKATTPEEYDKYYADICDELADKGVTSDKPEKDGDMYHIYYSYSVQVAESAKEEYELKGFWYYCKDCPWFGKSGDGRRRSAGCTKDVQNAVDYTPACEMFYTMLANGSIKPREE